MKIALFGHGNMGKMIEKIALLEGHHITLDLEEADVCIDFSHPDAVLKNAKLAAKAKKDLVIGTTGWYHALATLKEIVKEADIGALYSPNFSLGVQLFFKILEQCRTIMAPFQEYERAGLEIHHRKKVDAPSGTALEISKIMGEDLAFTSLRVGSQRGTHTVLFDSPFDTITLTHEAHSREGFALGALKAAQWLQGKKGVFTLKDFIEEKYAL